MTATALFPAPYNSLISLTYDDATRPARVAPKRQRTAGSVLDRVAQGDPRAVRECIDRYGGLIWSIALGMAGSRADAEAAVQEIFADVWRTAGRFDPEQGSEEIFVTQIARRRLIDRMRRGVQRDRTRSSGKVDSRGWVDRGNSAGVCREAMTAAQAVMQLRPELRKVLEMGLLQGLSQSEIADRLQIPLETVKTRMTRGLIQVREFMGN